MGLLFWFSGMALLVSEEIFALIDLYIAYRTTYTELYQGKREGFSIRYFEYIYGAGLGVLFEIFYDCNNTFHRFNPLGVRPA